MNYATLNINKKITGMLAAAGFFEWLVAGIVIGLVYQPDAAGGGPARRGMIEDHVHGRQAQSRA